MIYLDSNATSQVHPEVVEAMLPYLTDQWYNPSSGYRSARAVKQAITTARVQVAALINAHPGEIVFTGCGTESNNMALKWLARLVGREESRIVTSAIEHSAVLRPCEAMAEVERLIAQLPDGVAGAWSGLSYQERQAGAQASLLYALSALVVFLALAALYESWTIPISVMLAVPLGVLGAVLAAMVRGLPNDVFFQVGILTTVGVFHSILRNPQTEPMRLQCF